MENERIKAALTEVDDSGLVVTKSNGYHSHIPVEKIRSISLKRKNSVVNGALVGLGIGALTGMIAGVADGDQPLFSGPVSDPISAVAVGVSTYLAMTPKERTFAGGLALSGALIGAITGAVAKKKFTIGGRKETFRDLQAELMSKLVRK